MIDNNNPNSIRPLTPLLQDEILEPFMTKVNEVFEDHRMVSQYTIKCAIGFGHTIGNAIRRTAITNLTGYAIVAFKLDKAKHIFDAVDGIKELVQEIAINLKQIGFKLKNGLKTINLKLHLTNNTNSGMVIRAMDFEENDNVYIANPNQYICTLDLKKTIDLEVMIAFGRGYTMAEKQKFNHSSREFIPIDAIFAPVIKCGYEVQCFTGGKTNYDHVTVTLITNGTHSGDEVIAMTTEMLYRGFKNICTVTPSEEKEEEYSTISLMSHKAQQQQNKNTYADYPITSTDLSVRVKNKLTHNGINTIAELAALTEAQVLGFGGLGDVCMAEIKTFLSARGLCFGMNLNNSYNRGIQ